MKIFYGTIIAVLLLLPGLQSCSRRSEEQRFADTYREILINTEQYGATDSALAEKNMLKILEDEGYTLESFRETYIDLARKEPLVFMNMLDSVRQSVTNEVVRSGNKK